MEIVLAKERGNGLIDSLTQVWERSVRETHTFLTEAGIREIAAYVPAALREVPVLAVALEEGKPAGFLGIAGERVEMLFLDPSARGKGLGRQLLQYGMDQFGVQEVCVNEQNPQALGFYQHMGFQVWKRTETDEQGGPYPLLYLKRAR